MYLGSQILGLYNNFPSNIPYSMLPKILNRNLLIFKGHFIRTKWFIILKVNNYKINSIPHQSLCLAFKATLLNNLKIIICCNIIKFWYYKENIHYYKLI